MAFTTSIAEIIASDKTGLLSKHATWERVGLAEVASILNGAPFDSALFSTIEGVPLLRIRDVLSGTTSTYYTGTYDETYLVKPGDLLVGMDGDFNTDFWGATPALLNQRVCKITPNEAFYSKSFLGYVLPGYLAAINANTPSITVKHLSSKTVGDIELPLPPRAEQTRIVEKLEELLSDLDAGVAELKAAQKKLAQYRQSLLKAAVEGALTAAWRKHNPPGETGAQLLDRILRERRQRWEAKQLAKFQEQGKAPPEGWQDRYPEPVQPDTSGLSALPEGWVWSSLDQLVGESSYGTSVKCSYASNGDPVLRIPNIVARKIDLQNLKFATQELSLGDAEYLAPGDILVVRTNGSISLVGRAAEVRETLPRQFFFASYLLRLRSVETCFVHRWISAFLASIHGRKWIEVRAASSAGQHNISLSTLLTMPVVLPPIAEQEESLKSLEVILDNVLKQEQSIEISLKQSAAQRKNILKAAFSGQLVPQDPHDEPASVLLARIRAEQAARMNTSKPRGRKIKEPA